mmetsp:Transcript_83728/g.151063  ORF Transcript_83728/g.151063 Transcript_83728/m.151063 type:complete len:248 (+) Transcript_83728:187-930(+)
MELTRSQIYSENQIPVVPPGIFVHGGVEGRVIPVRPAQSPDILHGHGRDVHHWHRHVKPLCLAFLKLSLLLVPPGSFNEEAVDVLTFLLHLTNTFWIHRQDLRVRHDVIESPLVLLPLASHLLAYASQEPLGVDERGDAVGFHLLSAMLEPRAQLLVPIEKPGEPATDVRQQPGDLGTRGIVGPALGDTPIINGVQVLQQVCGHHHSPIDRHGKALQVAPDDADDVLQALQLLEQENVQRSAETSLL